MKNERNLSINKELQVALLKGTETMSLDEIEKRSRVQRRGKYSHISSEQKELLEANG